MITMFRRTAVRAQRQRLRVAHPSPSLHFLHATTLLLSLSLSLSLPLALFLSSSDLIFVSYYLSPSSHVTSVFVTHRNTSLSLCCLFASNSSAVFTVLLALTFLDTVSFSLLLSSLSFFRARTSVHTNPPPTAGEDHARNPILPSASFKFSRFHRRR